MANTGYLIQPLLKKVTDDVNEYPLDINNQLCSVTGLPQHTMANPTTASDYKVSDNLTCPVEGQGTNVIGTLDQYLRRLRLVVNFTITCGISMSITYTITTYDEQGNPTGTTTELLIGLTLGSNQIEAYNDGGSITAGPNDIINIVSFSFTPYSCGSQVITINGQNGTPPIEE